MSAATSTPPVAAAASAPSQRLWPRGSAVSPERVSTMANTMESHGRVSTGNHEVIGNCGKSRAPNHSGADASIVSRQALARAILSMTSRDGIWRTDTGGD